MTARQHKIEAIVRGYLQAFNERDVLKCMEYYAQDSSLSMLNFTYNGRSAITDWHNERFAAEAEIARIHHVRVKQDTVTIDADVTSSRLQALKINTVRGTGAFTIEDGKIKKARFKPRMYNPLESWGLRSTS